MPSNNDAIANHDATAAIESLENLFKAKIKFQDAQAEVEPMLDLMGLLFSPDALDEEQKTVLRNGLKNLRKLLDAHTAYSEAVKQAESARTIVHQLLGVQEVETEAGNGKAEKETSETKGKAEKEAASSSKKS
ncbi:MAG: hypothetical protein Kow00121_15450 [Elainellaceae cyanobacterium]